MGKNKEFRQYFGPKSVNYVSGMDPVYFGSPDRIIRPFARAHPFGARLRRF